MYGFLKKAERLRAWESGVNICPGKIFIPIEEMLKQKLSEFSNLKSVEIRKISCECCGSECNQFCSDDSCDKQLITYLPKRSRFERVEHIVLHPEDSDSYTESDQESWVIPAGWKCFCEWSPIAFRYDINRSIESSFLCYPACNALFELILVGPIELKEDMNLTFPYMKILIVKKLKTQS